MYEFLEGIGEWFAAHDLMSATAGHWLAWVFIVFIPVMVLMWWVWMYDKYSNIYFENRTPGNRAMLFIAATAPVSVPVVLLAAAVKYAGRRLGYLR